MPAQFGKQRAKILRTLDLSLKLDPQAGRAKQPVAKLRKIPGPPSASHQPAQGAPWIM